jgi:uncharacterized protein YndB with AHSA1/START domain
MTDGTVERDGDRVTFRYERRLKHPIDKVWHAITDPDELERWSGMRPELDLRVDGDYVTTHMETLRVVDKVLRVHAPHLFEHTFWVHVNPSATVTWNLSPTDGGTLLVLRHSLTMDDVKNAAETVAAGMSPLDILARNGAGWHHLLDLLTATLDGGAAPFSQEAEDTLRERYAAQLA